LCGQGGRVCGRVARGACGCGAEWKGEERVRRGESLHEKTNGFLPSSSRRLRWCASPRRLLYSSPRLPARFAFLPGECASRFLRHLCPVAVRAGVAPDDSAGGGGCGAAPAVWCGCCHAHTLPAGDDFPGHQKSVLTQQYSDRRLPTDMTGEGSGRIMDATRSSDVRNALPLSPLLPIGCRLFPCPSSVCARSSIYL
jgi:hypothetical protein